MQSLHPKLFKFVLYEKAYYIRQVWGKKKEYSKLKFRNFSAERTKCFLEENKCNQVSEDDHSYSSKSLVDKKIIRCRGGNGGGGLLSYIRHGRHKMIGPGWPSGGGGGIGGNVIVEASSKFYSLKHLNGFVFAQDGLSGGKRNSNGACGRDAVIKVPIGCVVSRLEKNEENIHKTKKFKKVFLADLNELNIQLVVASGGKGGRGNNSANPHSCTTGSPGEEAYIEIELKSIADAGFVGLPNAGKSTLLAAISQARPKIAPYPFTTLAPYIGTLQYEDGLRITVADIPGLVEGSHMNRGLGIEFLRHIERNKILVYVIDLAFNTQHVTPMQTFLLLRQEVAAYSADLLKKKFMIVANKCDIAPCNTLQAVDEFWKQLQADFSDIKFIPISARFGDGIPNFVSAVRELYLEAEKEIKLDLAEQIERTEQLHPDGLVES